MNRSWNVLNWNVRGINSSNKWLTISNKIQESNYSIICLQETEKEHFDSTYMKLFCPRRINKFDFVPSVGDSWGLLVAWNDSCFQGECLFKNKFSISIRFTSVHIGNSWILTNIYGPCDSKGKAEFLDWFQNIQMPTESDWLIAGDFKFIRHPHNRNMGTGDFSNMMQFNEAMSTLVLVEIYLKGRNFTWSNM